MPTPPPTHHEDEPEITSVVNGFAGSSHSDGPALEVLWHTAYVHDSAHPARKGLGTHRPVDAVLAGLQGAPDSVTVMKCGTRGAKEVGLNRRDGTDLLLHIRRDGQRSSEDWQPKFFSTEVLKEHLAGLRVTAKSAADELGTVGRMGPGGDTPQGPRLECELAEGELIVVGSRQPVLDDDRRVPGWLVDRLPRLRRSLLLDCCYEP